jgi:hypothetical protein
MAHGSKSRARTKQIRLNKKRAKKAEMQALYEARKRAGINKKSKRYLRNARKVVKVKAPKFIMEIPIWVRGKLRLASRTVHGGDECGNVGCKRCSPVWQNIKVA